LAAKITIEERREFLRLFNRIAERIPITHPFRGIDILTPARYLAR
jgi:hypothetical protein